MPGATAEHLDVTADYASHPEMEKIGTALIRRHEALQIYTNDITIAYRLRLGEPSGQGEELLAACQKAPPLWRDETGLDIVIWSWEAVWNALEPRQREALTAHELCHIGRNSQGGVKLRKHDLEDFAFVARQYGRWIDNVAHFAGALERYDEEQAKRPTSIKGGKS